MRRSNGENKEIKSLDKSEKLKEKMKAQKEEQAKNSIKVPDTKSTTAKELPKKKILTTMIE